MKKTVSIKQTVTKVLPFLLSLGMGAGSVSAASLLFDFGPTAIGSTVLTNSPAHWAGAVPGTEVSWNTGLISDSSSLVYSDGTTASGVSIVFGSMTNQTGIVHYDYKSFLNRAMGTFTNRGVYAAGCPAVDGLFGYATVTNYNAQIGCRIDGLPAGIYKLYCSGRDTGLVNPVTGQYATPNRFYGSNGLPATVFTYTSSGATPAVALEANSWPATVDSFVAGENYVLLTLTLSAGQSIFLAAGGTTANERRGFLNSLEVVPDVTEPATITTQPVGRSVVEGFTFPVSFGAGVAGQPPVYSQWLQDGVVLAGQTNTTIVFSNVTTSMAGSYSLAVSNAYGTNLSSSAVLKVTSIPNAAQTTNVWTLLPGDRAYLTKTQYNYERGLAYDPATTNLLLVCRWPTGSSVQTNVVAVLDALTGAERRFLNVGGIETSNTSGNGYGISKIGVADDGVVYAGSLTIAANSYHYVLYRWDDDSGSGGYTQAYAGDPAAYIQPNLRWGDNLAVRGSGTSTQILLAPATGTNVVLMLTSDGLTFQPAVIAVTGVPSSFALEGTAFGPGGNTFWAKSYNHHLYLVQFDPDVGTGTVVEDYDSSYLPGTIGVIGANNAMNLLAGLSMETPDDVQLYDVSDLTTGPVWLDREAFTVNNSNDVIGQGGSGAVAFGGNCLFVLDSNNGIMAFQISTNSMQPFSITSINVQTAGQIVLTCQSVAGSSYQLQYKNALSDTWSDTGAPITATGTTVFLTNSITGTAQFYRVHRQ